MTHSKDHLLAVLSAVKPLQLEGSQALLGAQRAAGQFFPPLNGIDKDRIIRMAVEVKQYTERCWSGTKRLNDLHPIPARLYIAEFGL